MRGVVWAAVGIGILLFGCGSGRQGSEAVTPAVGEVVATWTGHQLTGGDLLQEIERLPGASRAFLAVPERKREFLENMALNALLYEEGVRAGYERDPDVERQVTELRRRLVVQRVMRPYQSPPDIPDAEAQAYYDHNPGLYSGTQIHASHILVREEGAARALAAEVTEHPERFADLARERSIDVATAPKGGDLGTFGPGRMAPEFDETAFALKPGDLSPVVKTQYGYHLIRVVERTDGELLPFPRVKEHVKVALRNKAMQERVLLHFAELKRDAALAIHDDALARVTVPPAPSAPPALVAAPAP